MRCYKLPFLAVLVLTLVSAPAVGITVVDEFNDFSSGFTHTFSDADNTSFGPILLDPGFGQTDLNNNSRTISATLPRSGGDSVTISSEGDGVLDISPSDDSRTYVIQTDYTFDQYDFAAIGEFLEVKFDVTNFSTLEQVEMMLVDADGDDSAMVSLLDEPVVTELGRIERAYFNGFTADSFDLTRVTGMTVYYTVTDSGFPDDATVSIEYLVISTPEPGTIGLVLAGLGVVVVTLRRRQQAQA